MSVKKIAYFLVAVAVANVVLKQLDNVAGGALSRVGAA